MFSVIKRTIPVAIAIPIGGVSLSLVSDVLKNPTGSEGLSLLLADTPWLATLELFLALVFPVLLCSLFSVFSKRTTGLLACFLMLTVYAYRGGSMQGVVQRYGAEMARDYQLLLSEAYVWICLVGLICLGYEAVCHWGDRLGRRVGFAPSCFAAEKMERLDLASSLLTSVVLLGLTTVIVPLKFLILPAALMVLGLFYRGFKKTGSDGFLAAGLCLAVGQALAMLLIKNWQIGQVLTSLLISFTVGSLVGHMIFPRSKYYYLLFTPLLLCISHYFEITRLLDAREIAVSSRQLLNQTNLADLKMYGTGLALPIHYATAGVAGVLLGAAWAQTLISPLNEIDLNDADCRGKALGGLAEGLPLAEQGSGQ